MPVHPWSSITMTGGVLADRVLNRFKIKVQIQIFMCRKDM